MQYGIKSITMDDIARALSISKKTIYQHFADKKELVAHTTEAMLETERQECERIFQDTQDAIGEIIAISKHLRTHINKMNPSLFLDLQRYYKEGYKIYEAYKERVFFKLTHDSLARGIEEGYFRSDINPSIIALMRIEQIQLAYDSNVYPPDRYTFQEIQIELFNHFVHGIITDKGRKRLEAYLNTTSHNEISK